MNNVTPKMKKAVDDAVDLIHANLQEPISIDEIAGYLGVSRQHLLKAFTAVHGMSIKSYLIEVRDKAMAEYFVNTGKTRREIANKYCTGISAVSSSINKQLGMSMDEYRRLNFKKGMS